jgi:uncharacterized protein YndB with AHSA1/START domain
MITRDVARMTLTLPSEREFALTRVFDAPRRLVFEAWTKPEHVRRWYGCEAFTLLVCDIDLRIGGAYRYTMRAPDGVDHTLQASIARSRRPGGSSTPRATSPSVL